MNKFYSLLVSFFFINILSFGQITFQKSYGNVYGETGRSIQQTNDGGYIIGGMQSTFATFSMDFYLLKIDSVGDIQWAKSYGGNETDQGYSVKQTSDGGFVIAGYSEENGITSNACVIKTDANGDTLWTHIYGDNMHSQFFCVEQTSDNGYILAGDGFGISNLNAQFVKIDSIGNIIWKTGFGGSFLESITSVKQTFDGGYIATGFMLDTSVLGTDLYLVKLDPNGSVLWSKNYGGHAAEYGTSVVQTSDSGYIITGRTESFGVGNTDVYLVKTNETGDTLWTQTYGGTEYDAGNEVRQTNDGGYIIAGSTQSFGAISRDAYLIKTRPDGTLMWSKTFYGNDYDDALAVFQNDDYSYIMCGVAIISGSQKLYVVKTDSMGNSGCNEMTPLTIVNNTPTVVSSPQLQMSYIDSTSYYFHLTISGGSTMDVICLSTSINDFNNEDYFSVYPNPVIDDLNILFSELVSDEIIELNDILGNVVFKYRLQNEDQTVLSLGDLSNGIYFLRVHDSGRIFTNKIVVSK